MTPREIEKIQRESIYTLELTNDLKDQVINSYLNELNKFIKSNLKKRRLMIIVVKEH